MRNLLLLFLFFILIYYLFKFVTRLLFPFLFNKYRPGPANPFHSTYKQRKEGEVTIENTPKKEKKIKGDEGEYVDYKEVD